MKYVEIKSIQSLSMFSVHFLILDTSIWKSLNFCRHKYSIGIFFTFKLFANNFNTVFYQQTSGVDILK